MTDYRNPNDDAQQRPRRSNSYDDLDQYAVDAGEDAGMRQDRARYTQNRDSQVTNDSARYSRNSARYRHDGNQADSRPRDNRRAGQRPVERPESRSGRQQGTGSRQRPEFNENGRIDSVYRPTRNRSRYERSSNRYTSENAENRREGRREVRSVRVQPEQKAATAGRYSRDRYVRQEGQQRVMPVSQQSYAATNRAKPVSAAVLAVLAGVAVFLLVVIIARFAVFSGTAGEYGEIRTEIDAAQTHLTELETSTNEAQTQIDSWQETITTYNKSKK